MSSAACVAVGHSKMRGRSDAILNKRHYRFDSRSPLRAPRKTWCTFHAASFAHTCCAPSTTGSSPSRRGARYHAAEPTEAIGAWPRAQTKQSRKMLQAIGLDSFDRPPCAVAKAGRPPARTDRPPLTSTSHRRNALQRDGEARLSIAGGGSASRACQMPFAARRRRLRRGPGGCSDLGGLRASRETVTRSRRSLDDQLANSTHVPEESGMTIICS